MYAKSHFPSDLKGVLSQRNQFSTWKNRNISKPTKQVYKNIYKVLKGETNRLSYRYVYFKTGSGHQRGSGEKKIGDHYFTKY